MDSKSTTIKDWAEDDRPREKMLLKGKEALSNAELLAILINSGYKEKSALDLAKIILKKYDNKLTEISKLSPNELTNIKGIGLAKAVNISAAFEISRRRISESTDNQNTISYSTDAANYLIPHLRDKQHEEFYIICLNNANEIISTNKIGEGGLSSTSADIKKIFNLAIRNRANKLILGHNHPSNSNKPSETDIKLTKRIVEAGKILEIDVIDHIIITDNSYYSFADNNQITF